MSGARSQRGTNAPGLRALDGVLLLDKPAGITSQNAVQRVRRLLGARKAGHTGTLDPLATGLLPVCFGEATKFSHALLDSDKTYLATIRLGTTTTTGDLEGEITSAVRVGVDEPQVLAALDRFRGEIEQVPPMYSAIKHGGQPLYRLARAGKEVPRDPRRVWIRALRLLRFVLPDLEVAVTCSKGTYVRVLAEDIGRELGCGACLAALRRTGVGNIGNGASMVTLEELEAMTEGGRNALLLPEDTLLAGLPRLDLNELEAGRLAQGQPVDPVATPAPGLVRVYGPGRKFLGMAEVVQAGRVVPRRLCRPAHMMAQPPVSSIA